MEYTHSNRLDRKTRFSAVRFLAGILFLALIFLAIKSIIPNFSVPNSSIISVETKKSQGQSLPQLEIEIKKLVGTQKGSWSIYFLDLNDVQRRIGINENVIHRAASVNKLYVLASLYYLAAKGEIDLDETVTLSESDIQDYGTGTIRYDSPGTVYSLKTLARLLIEKSDNTAEYILRIRIGDEKIQNLVDEFDFSQTSIADNKTSLSDVEALFKKIENKEITNKAYTQEMMDFLNQTDFEDRLPALLPKDARVYHKIGNEVGNIHDVGMIIKDNKKYFLGIMTSDIGDTEEEAKKTIVQISKMVYDFEYGNN